MAKALYKASSALCLSSISLAVF